MLCKKPMMLMVVDSEPCFAAASEAGLFLVETFWTDFYPAMRIAIEIVRSSEIGAPRQITANFVSLRGCMAYPILFALAPGGGVRNDLGIYPVGTALLLAGPANRVSSQPIDGTTNGCLSRKKYSCKSLQKHNTLTASKLEFLPVKEL